MAARDPLEPAVHAGAVNTPRSASETAAAALLGHQFADPGLLAEALTHRSALITPQRGGAKPRSNERLEFIGDRVLGLLIAEWLAELFPDEAEGDLGRRLGHLVAQPALAAIAEEVGLPAVLSVAPGEARAGVKRLATVLADAIEAAIGALYLDGGLVPARAFVRRAWAGLIAAHPTPPKDAKSALQEWALAHGNGLPDYVVAARHGPPHAPMFVIEVRMGGVTGRGEAGAKRAAEQLAAADLLAQVAP